MSEIDNKIAALQQLSQYANQVSQQSKQAIDNANNRVMISPDAVPDPDPVQFAQQYLLEQKRIKRAISIYRQNPSVFNKEQLFNLRDQASKHGISFDPTATPGEAMVQATAPPVPTRESNIGTILRQLPLGYIEGATGLARFNDKPVNTIEGIARSIGSLLGFVGAGIGGKSLPMLVSHGAVRGAEKAAIKAGGKKVEGFIAKSIENTVGKEALMRRVGSEAIGLGAASAFSAIPDGVNQVFQSALHGALFGAAFGAIGAKFPQERKEAVPLYKLLFDKATPIEKNDIVRTLGGALAQGGLSAASGEPAPKVVYETLLGGYFGVKGGSLPTGFLNEFNSKTKDMSPDERKEYAKRTIQNINDAFGIDLSQETIDKSAERIYQASVAANFKEDFIFTSGASHIKQSAPNDATFSDDFPILPKERFSDKEIKSSKLSAQKKREELTRLRKLQDYSERKIRDAFAAIGKQNDDIINVKKIYSKLKQVGMKNPTIDVNSVQKALDINAKLDTDSDAGLSKEDRKYLEFVKNIFSENGINGEQDLKRVVNDYAAINSDSVLFTGELLNGDRLKNKYLRKLFDATNNKLSKQLLVFDPETKDMYEYTSSGFSKVDSDKVRFDNTRVGIVADPYITSEDLRYGENSTIVNELIKRSKKYGSLEQQAAYGVGAYKKRPIDSFIDEYDRESIINGKGRSFKIEDQSTNSKMYVDFGVDSEGLYVDLSGNYKTPRKNIFDNKDLSLSDRIRAKTDKVEEDINSYKVRLDNNYTINDFFHTLNSHYGGDMYAPGLFKKPLDISNVKNLIDFYNEKYANNKLGRARTDVIGIDIGGDPALKGTKIFYNLNSGRIDVAIDSDLLRKSYYNLPPEEQTKLKSERNNFIRKIFNRKGFEESRLKDEVVNPFDPDKSLERMSFKPSDGIDSYKNFMDAISGFKKKFYVAHENLDTGKLSFRRSFKQEVNLYSPILEHLDPINPSLHAFTGQHYVEVNDNESMPVENVNAFMRNQDVLTGEVHVNEKDVTRIAHEVYNDQDIDLSELPDKTFGEKLIEEFQQKSGLALTADEIKRKLFSAENEDITPDELDKRIKQIYHIAISSHIPIHVRVDISAGFDPEIKNIVSSGENNDEYVYTNPEKKTKLSALEFYSSSAKALKDEGLEQVSILQVVEGEKGKEKKIDFSTIGVNQKSFRSLINEMSNKGFNFIIISGGKPIFVKTPDIKTDVLKTDIGKKVFSDVDIDSMSDTDIARKWLKAFYSEKLQTSAHNFVPDAQSGEDVLNANIHDLINGDKTHNSLWGETPIFKHASRDKVVKYLYTLHRSMDVLDPRASERRTPKIIRYDGHGFSGKKRISIPHLLNEMEKIGRYKPGEQFKFKADMYATEATVEIPGFEKAPIDDGATYYWDDIGAPIYRSAGIETDKAEIAKINLSGVINGYKLLEKTANFPITPEVVIDYLSKKNPELLRELRSHTKQKTITIDDLNDIKLKDGTVREQMPDFIFTDTGTKLGSELFVDGPIDIDPRIINIGYAAIDDTDAGISRQIPSQIDINTPDGKAAQDALVENVVNKVVSQYNDIVDKFRNDPKAMNNWLNSLQDNSDFFSSVAFKLFYEHDFYPLHPAFDQQSKAVLQGLVKDVILKMKPNSFKGELGFDIDKSFPSDWLVLRPDRMKGTKVYDGEGKHIYTVERQLGGLYGKYFKEGKINEKYTLLPQSMVKKYKIGDRVLLYRSPVGGRHGVIPVEVVGFTEDRLGHGIVLNSKHVIFNLEGDYDIDKVGIIKGLPKELLDYFDKPSETGTQLNRDELEKEVDINASLINPASYIENNYYVASGKRFIGEISNLRQIHSIYLANNLDIKFNDQQGNLIFHVVVNKDPSVKTRLDQFQQAAVDDAKKGGKLLREGNFFYFDRNKLGSSLFKVYDAEGNELSEERVRSMYPLLKRISEPYREVLRAMNNKDGENSTMTKDQFDKVIRKFQEFLVGGNESVSDLLKFNVNKTRGQAANVSKNLYGLYGINEIDKLIRNGKGFDNSFVYEFNRFFSDIKDFKRRLRGSKLTVGQIQNTIARILNDAAGRDAKQLEHYKRKSKELFYELERQLDGVNPEIRPELNSLFDYYISNGTNIQRRRLRAILLYAGIPKDRVDNFHSKDGPALAQAAALSIKGKNFTYDDKIDDNKYSYFENTINELVKEPYKRKAFYELHRYIDYGDKDFLDKLSPEYKRFIDSYARLDENVGIQRFIHNKIFNIDASNTNIGASALEKIFEKLDSKNISLPDEMFSRMNDIVLSKIDDQYFNVEYKKFYDATPKLKDAVDRKIASELNPVFHLLGLSYRNTSRIFSELSNYGDFIDTSKINENNISFMKAKAIKGKLKQIVDDIASEAADKGFGTEDVAKKYISDRINYFLLKKPRFNGDRLTGKSTAKYLLLNYQTDLLKKYSDEMYKQHNIEIDYEKQIIQDKYKDVVDTGEVNDDGDVTLKGGSIRFDPSYLEKDPYIGNDIIQLIDMYPELRDADNFKKFVTGAIYENRRAVRDYISSPEDLAAVAKQIRQIIDGVKDPDFRTKLAKLGLDELFQSDIGKRLRGLGGPRLMSITLGVKEALIPMSYHEMMIHDLRKEHRVASNNIRKFRKAITEITDNKILTKGSDSFDDIKRKNSIIIALMENDLHPIFSGYSKNDMEADLAYWTKLKPEQQRDLISVAKFSMDVFGDKANVLGDGNHGLYRIIRDMTDRRNRYLLRNGLNAESVPGFRKNLFPHMWKSKKTYFAGVDEFIKTKRIEGVYTEKELLDLEKDLKSRYYMNDNVDADKMIDPEAYRKDAEVRNANLLMRKYDIPNYDRDWYSVMNRYAQRIYNKEAMERWAFGDEKNEGQYDRIVKMAKGMKSQDIPDEDIEKFIAFEKNYIRDNLGHPTKESKIFGVNISDENVADGINKLLEKLGVDKKITPYQVVNVSKFDARANFFMFLTGSRSFFNNIVGGGANMLIDDGYKTIKKARRLLKTIEEAGASSYEDLPPALRSVFNDREEYNIYSEMQRELGTSDIMYNFTKFEGQLGHYLTEGEVYSFMKTFMMDKNKAIDMLKTKTNIREGVSRYIIDVASGYMRSSEYMLRRSALAVGILKGKELGLRGEALSSYAENYVYRTQFDYSNVDSPAFRRSTVGRMFSRFLIVNWRSAQLMNSIYKDWNSLGRPTQFENLFSGERRESEEFKKFARMAIFGMFMAGLATIFPYSIFNSSIPQPFDAATDFANMVFNPDEDIRKTLQYGGYGSSLVAAPIMQKTVLAAIYAALFSDYKYDVSSFVPKVFSEAYKLYSYPQYAVETISGIPLLSLKKKIKEQENE